jgi:hypothetical protein
MIGVIKMMVCKIIEESSDGHVRITRGDNFLIVGGSEESHVSLQNTIMTLSDKLNDRDLSSPEIVEILNELNFGDIKSVESIDL